jgi:uncharacterized protein (TIGR00645 family)
MGGSDVILAVLKLVDLVFIANLVILIISAGLELFMPRRPDAEHSTLDFAILKVRVFASISAIAAIDLLESFVDIDRADKTGVLWQTVILLAFVVSGVLLAWMDRLSAARH